MLRKSLVFILFGLFSFIQLNAQDENQTLEFLSLKNKSTNSKTPDNYYLNPTWQYGVVELNSSQKMDTALIKYNSKEGFLELKEKNNILLLPIHEVKSVFLTKLDLLLTFAYSTRKITQSVSSVQKIEKLLKVKDSKAKPTPKECYVSQYWQTANISFDKDKTLENALVKFNLKTNCIEIKKIESVLVLPISRVNEVYLDLKKETLTSLTEYDNSEARLSGLLNVFYTKSDISLASNDNLRVIVPSGSSSYGTTKSNKNSYKIANILVLIQGNKLFKLEKKTKKNAHLFGEYWEEVAAFIKTEKLSFKTKEDLIKIIDFYSNLVNA